MVEKKLLSRAEAAEYLNISTRTLDRLLADAQIAYVKLGSRGGRITFLQKDLDAYIDRQRVDVRVAEQLRGSTTWRRKRTSA